jgi:uncharacterized membrane protein
MNKKEFLEELEEYLIGISKADKDEILQDYEEHFRVGKKKKRSESSIVKSLGEPRQIARDVRQELSSSEREELKSEAIETWVATKKFSKHLFNEMKNNVDKVIYSDKKPKKNSNLSMWISILLILAVVVLFFHSIFFRIVIVVILAFLIYKYIKNKEFSKGLKVRSVKNKSLKRRGGEEKSFLRIVLCLIFNVLFFIWFWISVLAVIVGLFIASLAIMISGVVLIVFAIFAFLNYNSIVIKDILLSGFFAGLGTVILGGLLLSLSEGITKLFFRITKVYIELNMRFIEK